MGENLSSCAVVIERLVENNDAILRTYYEPFLATFSLVTVLSGCSNKPPLDCTIDTSDYEQSTFKEPATPSGVPAPLSASDDNTRLSQFQLNRNANAGNGARTYWLTGDEDAFITGDFALGKDAGKTFFGSDVRVSVLIGDVQVPFVIDDEAVADVQIFTVPSGAGVFSHRVLIAHDVIPDGANNASIVYIMDDGYTFSSWDFVILKNATQFAPKTSVDVELEKLTGGETVTDLDSGQSLDQNYFVNQTDALRLRIPVKSAWSGCADLNRPYAIAALVDGVLHAFTGAEPVPHVDVAGNVTAFFETSLTGLPFDGEAHTLSILQVEDGAYWEAPLGTLSPLPDPAQVIGRGNW